MPDSSNRPSLARNVISGIGLIVALISLANIIFLVVADMTGTHNPYVGILAYAVIPAFLLAGILLFFIGMLVERRRRHKAAPGAIERYPSLDLNIPRVRRLAIVWAFGSFFFIIISLLGSYRMYEYTDSDQFCGLVCHKVMHPEFTAYKQSPHARVGCVGCHVGEGAGWYVRSKLSGVYQVYSVLARKYPQ